MPKIDRLILTKGAAEVEFNGAFFYSREPITLNIPREENEIPSDAFGPLRKALTTQRATLSFTPIGEVEDLAVLYPHGSAALGSSIMGAAADEPLIIRPLNSAQKMITFHSAGVAQMPALRFSARDTVFGGPVTFAFVGKNNTEVSAAERLFAWDTNDIGATNYNAANLLIKPYVCKWQDSPVSITLSQSGNTTAEVDLDGTGDAAALQAAWNALANNDATFSGDWDAGFLMTFDANGAETTPTGAITAGAPEGSSVRVSIVQTGTAGQPAIFLIEIAPWGNFETEAGVTVNFAQTNGDEVTDSIGLYDITLQSLAVSLSCAPRGIDQEQLLAAAAIQGTYAAPGSDMSAIARNLDVKAAGLYFRLYGAQLDGAGLNWSRVENRIPALTWSASRTVTGGALDPLFAISTSPIA